MSVFCTQSLINAAVSVETTQPGATAILLALQHAVCALAARKVAARIRIGCAEQQDDGEEETEESQLARAAEAAFHCCLQKISKCRKVGKREVGEEKVVESELVRREIYGNRQRDAEGDVEAVDGFEGCRR